MSSTWSTANHIGASAEKEPKGASPFCNQSEHKYGPLAEASEEMITPQPYVGDEAFEKMLEDLDVSDNQYKRFVIQGDQVLLVHVKHFAKTIQILDYQLGNVSPTGQQRLRALLPGVLSTVGDTVTSEPQSPSPDVGPDQNISDRSGKFWELLARALEQPLCEVLCLAGTNLDCNAGAVIVGIFGMVQPAFNDLTPAEVFSMVSSAIVCILIFSSWVMKAAVNGNPNASSSTSQSRKRRNLEKLSNLLGGVALIGGAMGTFTNIFHTLPPLYAVSSIASCLTFVGFAACLSYHTG